MPEPLDLTGLETVSSGITTFTEGGQRYVHLPLLRLPDGCNPAATAALICMDTRDGYPTRLFFAQPIASRTSLNWRPTTAIAGKQWYSFSWNNVPSSTRPVEVLIGHLTAFVP
jgi:hypothetical protein